MNTPIEVAGTNVKETEPRMPIPPLVFTDKEELKAISERIATHMEKTSNTRAKTLLDVARDLIRSASHYIDNPNP